MTHASPILFSPNNGTVVVVVLGLRMFYRPDHFLQGRIQTRRPGSTSRAWLNAGTRHRVVVRRRTQTDPQAL
jgi:hypothetical protein